MNYIYIRSKNDRYSLHMQEDFLQEYMRQKGIPIDAVHFEVAAMSTKLEARDDLREFIHSLKSGDQVFIYDLRVISQRVGEVVQFLNCIFNHDLELIVAKYDVTIDKNTPSSLTISLLNLLREENKSIQMHTGRPKGSISSSKYDKFRDTIIQMLKEGKNVSTIAKILGASRSSIRDYIASRELDKIAFGEKNLIECEEVPQPACKINQKG